MTTPAIAPDAPAPAEATRFLRAAQGILQTYRVWLGEACRVQHLSRTQFFALNAIAETGGLKNVELAHCLGLTPGAASNMADRLEAQGLLQRDADPRNRRSVLLTLTPAGRQTLAEIGAAKEARERDAFEKLGEAEQALLIRALERWREILESDTPGGRL